MTPPLRLRGIGKSFGATTALGGVDLTLAPGTIHVLLGENGAGKSTLMHIVAGLLRADSGTMEVGGTAYAPTDTRAARRAAIGMIHQHFTSVAALTVWENIALAAGWPLGAARARAAGFLSAQGARLDPNARAGALSVGSRLQLELMKALAGAPTILLLDEPTGVLTPSEVAAFFRTIGEFTTRGGSALLVTHKLDEAVAHADAITVLRGGEVTLTWGGVDQGPTPDRETLIGAMLGRTERLTPRTGSAGAAGPVVAQLPDLQVRGGEVIGIAGVEGNGQRELLRSIPTDAFIPEDRTTEGLILDFSLTENL
ncbi:MAG TPA: ATP-binding cassette domain-containing protein, partial [Gemmatimonadales bacterium]|nr:ATP-binding cassette domain-containing protein [Gemmatimonadales bacterium]